MTSRDRLRADLAEAALAQGRPLLLASAPRGAGKTRLLADLEEGLARSGAVPVPIDMERLATGASGVAAHLPAIVARAARRHGEDGPTNGWPSADAIEADLAEERARRKPDSARLLDLSFAYPDALARDTGRPIILLLDELGEISALARGAALRAALRIVARRLAAPSAPAMVATLSPASRPERLLGTLREEARASGRTVRVEEMPPLEEADLVSLLAEHGCPPPAEPEAAGKWLRVAAARPLHAVILARRIARFPDLDLAGALVEELGRGTGALHQECRFDYHLLVERSRGHAAVRSILQHLARHDSANLSSVARHLGIALPTALDYLSWLLEVGLIRREARSYVCADPILRLWIRLNGPSPPDAAEDVLAFLGEPAGTRTQVVRTTDRVPSERPPTSRRPAAAAAAVAGADARGADLLMEID